MAKRIVVLASGSGSNFQNLVEYSRNNKTSFEIIGLIVNIEGVFAIERANAANIPCKIVPHKNYVSKPEFEAALNQEIENFAPDYIVCAGFMRILSAEFTQKWEGKIINIHPSLLPKYKGLHTHARAIEAGEDEAGCSVHFVNAGVDEGALIGQAKVKIENGETEDSLAKKVLVKEHILFPKCLEALCNGDVVFQGGKAIINGGNQLICV